MQVTKGLRRVQWAENEYFLVRCLLSGVKGRFSRIPLLASLAASLSKYHPTLGVALADELLEEVILGAKVCFMAAWHGTLVLQLVLFVFPVVLGNLLFPGNLTTKLS